MRRSGLHRQIGRALAILILGLAAGTSHAASKDPARYEAELKQLRSKISSLDQALAADKRDRDSLSARIRAEEKKLAQAARESRQAEAELAEQAAAVKSAEAQLEASRASVEQGKRDLATAIRATYMAGNPGPMQLLFEASRATSLQRIEADMTAVARAVQRRLDALTRRVAELDAARSELETRRQQLAERSQQLAAASEKLERAQEDRRRQLEKLTRGTVSKSKALETARAEQAKVENLLEQLRQIVSESPMDFERGKPFKSLRGRLPWPMPGTLLARFGSLKGGGPLTWTGWWIGGDEGNPVRAVADGRVVYVGWVQRYGLVVILDHPGPYLTLYGHIRENAVEVGDVVSAGTRIASAGSSGGHERSGVYFEIRQGTTAVNPSGWMAK